MFDAVALILEGEVGDRIEIFNGAELQVAAFFITVAGRNIVVEGGGAAGRFIVDLQHIADQFADTAVIKIDIDTALGEEAAGGPYQINGLSGRIIVQQLLNFDAQYFGNIKQSLDIDGNVAGLILRQGGFAFVDLLGEGEQGQLLGLAVEADTAADVQTDFFHKNDLQVSLGYIFRR